MNASHIKAPRRVLSFDYALKRLLRQKANYDILEGFLSELLGRPIKIKNIPEGESQQDKVGDKQTRVDILAEEESGELMIIEVQYQFEIDYLLRVLFGVSRNIFDFIQKGQPYEKIRKIYSISIIFFKEFHNDDEYIYHGKTDFKGMHTGKILTLTPNQQKAFGKIEAGDLHPEYYLLDVTNFNDVAKNTLDEWIYYLKNNRVEDNFTALGLNKVREILDYDSLPPAEQRSYDKTNDLKLGWDSAIKTAKIEGRSEGEAERKQLQQALAAEKEKAAAQAARIAELEKQLLNKKPNNS
ncbi:hypothetical protein FACS189452_04280 [Bacteroidia bacterium]|nr:hypothetical protein FACS189452_04280 [Bacteroidia bacterium]GHT81099.1 hypothetical protein FACS189467_4580 [Bacteroidia bacterium]